MASATEIVSDVFAEFDGRQGWDEFWDSIEPDVRKEIETELVNVVDQHLDDQQPENRTANTVAQIVVVRKGDGKKLFDAYATTEGGYKCRLPLTGVTYNEAFGDSGQVALIVGGHRVAFEDID